MLIDRHPLFAEMLAQALAAERDVRVEILASEREPVPSRVGVIVIDPSDRFVELNDFEDWPNCRSETGGRRGRGLLRFDDDVAGTDRLVPGDWHTDWPPNGNTDSRFGLSKRSARRQP